MRLFGVSLAAIGRCMRQNENFVTFVIGSRESGSANLSPYLY
jgi:hypothetical protein